MKNISIEERLAIAEHERDVFAKAIHDAAVKTGIVTSDTPVTGSELVALVDEMATLATRTHPKNGYIRFADQLPKLGESIMVAAPLIVKGLYSIWEEEWNGRELIGVGTHWRPVIDTGPGENG